MFGIKLPQPCLIAKIMSNLDIIRIGKVPQERRDVNRETAAQAR
jgi:hypothetical protein